MRQAGIWLARVQAEMGDDLQIKWRSFALEQVNSKEGDDWKAWQQGDDYVSRGLWPLRGGIAARRQSEDAHGAYMETILKLKHVDREDIRSRDAVVEAARRIGSPTLDMDRFIADIDDPETLVEIGRDHEEALTHGVFGTPTIIFEDGTGSFIKTYTPPEEDTMSAFEHLMGVMRGAKYFGEIKRPQPPWPRGVND